MKKKAGNGVIWLKRRNVEEVIVEIEMTFKVRQNNFLAKRE